MLEQVIYQKTRRTHKTKSETITERDNELRDNTIKLLN